jgi:hypothetical protein
MSISGTRHITCTLAAGHTLPHGKCDVESLLLIDERPDVRRRVDAGSIASKIEGSERIGGPVRAQSNEHKEYEKRTADCTSDEKEARAATTACRPTGWLSNFSGIKRHGSPACGHYVGERGRVESSWHQASAL